MMVGLPPRLSITPRIEAMGLAAFCSNTKRIADGLLEVANPPIPGNGDHMHGHLLGGSTSPKNTEKIKATRPTSSSSGFTRNYIRSMVVVRYPMPIPHYTQSCEDAEPTPGLQTNHNPPPQNGLHDAYRDG